MEISKNELREKTEELYRKSEYQQLLNKLNDEVLITQNDSSLFSLRVMANIQLEKNISDSMVYAEKAILIDPLNYLGYFARGLVWFDREEFLRAIDDFTKSIEFNWDFADAYYNRGLAYKKLLNIEHSENDLNKAFLLYGENPKYAYEHHNKGFILYCKASKSNLEETFRNKLYNNAIIEYSNAIQKKPAFVEAFYNRGLTYFAIKDYSNAIKDYSEAIFLKAQFSDNYYFDRGNAYRANNEFQKAIDDYTKAIKINPKFGNAYYYRGLLRIELKNDSSDKQNNINLEKSKKDFQIYLNEFSEINDPSVKYAKSYLKKIDKLKDKELSKISELVDEIKEMLRFDKEEVAHFTTLTAAEKLIIENGKFRIYEGNFMNDPSEGKEFFNLIKSEKSDTNYDNTDIEIFSSKPFIGSFVTIDRTNDLNMWRFYGKQDGIEAKGCAIVFNIKSYIENIKNSLSNEKNKDARIDVDENDINFYRVVYVAKNSSTKFYISKFKKEKINLLNNKFEELRKKILSYKGNKSNINEDLLKIAFLFKRDDYKDENEVRLVMNGNGFEKKQSNEKNKNQTTSPRKVFIELEPIKEDIKRIILGPKADNASEWASSLYYSYQNGQKPPTIDLSHLPYK